MASRLILHAIRGVVPVLVCYSALSLTLNAQGGHWETKTPMPIAKSDFGIAKGPDGRIYVIGGLTQAYPYINTNSVEVFDPSTNTWASAAPLLRPVYSLAAVSVGELVYAIGGYDGYPVNCLQVYDPTKNTWTYGPPMRVTRYHPTVVAGADGRIYVMGGDQNIVSIEQSMDVYDPATNAWASLPQMPTIRFNQAASLGQDGLIYSIGGIVMLSPYLGIWLNLVEAYNPSTGTWSLRAPMPTARSNATAATATDGTIYVFGGGNGPGDSPGAFLSTVEGYKPSTNSSFPDTPMPTARADMKAVTGSDGKIYVFGGLIPHNGWYQSVSLNVVEAFSTDSTPPVITPILNGTPGLNGWYVSPVSVNWSVVDPESGIASSSGCQATTLTGDTAGTTITCSATNGAGLSASSSVTIKIDRTPPTVSCSANPSTIWPPNQKMVPVTVSVNVADAVSGPNGFVLVSATSNEPETGSIQGFVVGTASTNGLLKADRLGTGNGRIYSLVYQGEDKAGNTTNCTATVTVPHDQGR